MHVATLSGCADTSITPGTVVSLPQPCAGVAAWTYRFLSSLAVETWGALVVCSRFGQGFCGPRGLVREALGGPFWANALSVVPSSAKTHAAAETPFVLWDRDYAPL